MEGLKAAKQVVAVAVVKVTKRRDRTCASSLSSNESRRHCNKKRKHNEYQSTSQTSSNESYGLSVALDGRMDSLTISCPISV